jgi:hypothetical protein
MADRNTKWALIAVEERSHCQKPRIFLSIGGFGTGLGWRGQPSSSASMSAAHFAGHNLRPLMSLAADPSNAPCGVLVSFSGIGVVARDDGSGNSIALSWLAMWVERLAAFRARLPILGFQTTRFHGIVQDFTIAIPTQTHEYMEHVQELFLSESTAKQDRL